MAVGIWDGGADADVALDAALLRTLLAFCRQSAAEQSAVNPSSPDQPSSAVNQSAARHPAAVATVLGANQLQHSVSSAEQFRLSGLMRRDLADWKAPLATLSDAELVELVRFFALAEVELPGWEAGKRSPAIACARELRARGSYPVELTRWLRQHSNNRFLPYGSLMDNSG